MHPAYLLGATSRVPIEVDETAIVGAILGHPLQQVHCKTVALDVPADAEMILEGAIEAGAREPEGPFGEYTRHSSGRSTNHVFTLRAITTRARPVFLDICPGGSREHLNLGQVPAEAGLLEKLRETLPNVKAVFTPYSGTIYHCYVSIEKRRPSDGRQAALLVLGLDPYVKLVVVVDDDIDITNEPEVLWAMATRMQAGEDAIIVDDMTCNLLDPSSSKGGTSSKLAIDATRPQEFAADRLTLPKDAIAWARELAASDDPDPAFHQLGRASAPILGDSVPRADRRPN
jgi:UbiD family decarboxylase